MLDGGKALWRKPVGTKVVTAPLVAGERIFVLGVDRRVIAWDALDGRKLWRQQRPGEPLTLAQGGVLAAFKTRCWSGRGRRLAGLDPLNGSVRWEAPMARRAGTNDVERLADLVGPLCARATASACAPSSRRWLCVNAERGNLVWSKNVGGTEGIGGNEQVVIGADASDRITARRTASGERA